MNKEINDITKDSQVNQGMPQDLGSGLDYNISGTKRIAVSYPSSKLHELNQTAKQNNCFFI